MRFIILLFLLTSTLTQAQTFGVEEHRSSFHHSHEPVRYTIAKNNTNELQYFFSGLFLLYKFAISSQDYNKCTFHPSCSEYGILAVKKQGVLLGMLATLDRLQRCNGLSPEKYPYDTETNLLIDFP